METDRREERMELKPMKNKGITLSVLALGAAVIFSFLSINSNSLAHIPSDDDDPGFTNARSNIARLLNARNYRKALLEAANTLTETAKKRNQPKFVQRRQLMEMLEYAAKAYEGVGNYNRALISRRQIITLYPLPDYKNKVDETRWNLVNEFSVNAVSRLVGDYRRINQGPAGVAYFQLLQDKYPKTPVAKAAAEAENMLK